MGSIYQFVSELFQKDRPQLIRQDIGRTGNPADSGKDYFRVRLAEMYLSDERSWMRTVFPAFAGIARCQFGSSQQELAHVIDPAKMIQPNWGTGLILRDVVMCPTLPFRGNTVEVTAVLKSMVVANHLTAFIS